jgi:amino acid transporter
LLITPYFGFETVPQMVEEGDFPIKNSKKAICGSILTCGIIYVFYYFCVAGLDSMDNLLTAQSANGFLTITAMQNLLGWKIWPVIVGLLSCLMGMGASLLGFWMSTVRMLYSMSKKNFLPEAFSKVNKHQQPILPNVFLLVVSIVFIVLQNAGSFMNDFFNLMSFGCACAYALTMISAVRIHHKYEAPCEAYRSRRAVRIPRQRRIKLPHRLTGRHRRRQHTPRNNEHRHKLILIEQKGL